MHVKLTPVLLFLALIAQTLAFCQSEDPNNGLKHWMTPEEAARRDEIGRNFVATDPPPGSIRNVEEFGPSEAVLIRYPFGIPMTLIKEMAEDGKVITIVANTSQQATVNSQYQSNGINTANCSYLIAASDSYWTRDYGPWFVTYGDLQTGIVDFPYNRPRPNDDEIPKKVAELLGIEWFGMNVIHTGGNYMTDGLHQSSSTTLVWEENLSQTHEQIAQKFQDYLGVNNYMVVEDPNGTYIDHIDCWGKFLGPDKVLVRKVPPSHAHYNEIEATAAYFASQISSYGTPYRVFRVNTPNNEPYTNSYSFNNKVFVPFMGTANDAGAMLAYQQAMPGYQISGYLQLPSAAWESTDALHCRTHEIADRGMLYIDHLPLLGTVPAQAGFTIQADITAYSQQAIYGDSVWVIYKVNGGAYDTISMVNTNASHYIATIPGQMEGSSIAYYIQAEDASGRTAKHPFIGAADPHQFQISVSSPPDLVVSPDTLFFTTYEDIIYGKQVLVRNFTAETVNVENVDPSGTGTLPWYIDPWNLNLPEPVLTGDSLNLTVKIAIPIIGKTNWSCDSLFINTAANIHKVMICVDPFLLNGMPDPRSIGLNIYPNPATDEVFMNFNAKGDRMECLEILNSAGQQVAVFPVQGSGLQTLHWNLKSSRGQKVAPGLYFIRLISGDKMATGKIAVIR